MAEIVGVRFKNAGKVYYFNPAGHIFTKSQQVIVETANGIECGEVVIPNQHIDDKSHAGSLRKVLRAVTNEDLAQIEKSKEKEVEAMQICAEKISKHKLDMKLIGAEYSFDSTKVLFYFTSEGRVDFRELVKDLASVLKVRIELRQIGVRDEAKILGGLGICGRPFCCATFLGEFQPVSIKMAKEQGLSLNPTKISGTCGRLMCCLKYEQNAYEDLIRTTPKTGWRVKTPEGNGVISEVSLLTGMLKIVLDDSIGGSTASFHKDTVEPINDIKKEKDDYDTQKLSPLREPKPPRDRKRK